MGTVESPETSTRITFTQAADVSVTTPALAAGATTQLHVPIPAECFIEGGGNCTIIIKADALLEAYETSEGNNEVKDVCPGAGK